MSLFSRCLKIRKIQVRWFYEVCTQMKKTTTSNRNLQRFLAKDDAAGIFEFKLSAPHGHVVASFSCLDRGSQ